ncbi:hypothetical protein NL676_018273 [Syzygium grande]|nr:hypothetical protein NL676_018273 [Syzygium grande]
MPTPLDLTPIGATSHALVVAYPMSPYHLSVSIYIRPVLVVYQGRLTMQDLANAEPRPGPRQAWASSTVVVTSSIAILNGAGEMDDEVAGKRGGDNGEGRYNGVQAAIATKAQ